MSSRREIHVRVKMGMVEMNDVHQHFRPDVDIFFYFKATKRDLQGIKENDIEGESYEDDGCDFHGLHRTDAGIWPFWEPHFDFQSETEMAFITDYSYWIKGDIIYGRKNILPKLQQRINHTAFPYDRQIVDVVLLSNNCLFRRWDIANNCPKEQRLSYDEWHVQGMLNALADLWDLERIRMRIQADEENMNSKATIFLYVQREHEYYTFNISLMLFMIVSLQTWIPNFPYNESRYDFALQLVLTQIAFRFVTQNLIPLTSYLMYLDKFMLLGFALLFVRFIVDFCLPFFLPVPETGTGDEFRCNFEVDDFFTGSNCWFGGDYSSAECNNLAEICVRDFQISIAILVFWIIASASFLVPRFWRRTWKQVEIGLDQQKGTESTFWTKGSSKPVALSRVSVADWLEQHSEGVKDQPSFADNYRSALELKGWAEPEDEEYTRTIYKKRITFMDGDQVNSNRRSAMTREYRSTSSSDMDQSA
mmetsp:Transcript_16739/g.24746  ORF Transcript_16739/g.24746 Transcript_16739/m.24746 type:complete len:477 (+) Transcript_16739:258-1688(+)|eukprot:CAMPEP_0194227288 /NCGR_PEP_ID=MMETSP0156-20130528/42780_1 /TAXON_ID=33649 /ORGANISM="Thalassionema nitzschioides, Strain L26-B" /LENGTH=476 /DNA_ID=CAMNT_0038959767 /DNA_START=196 /DNA_END=1626 /DNA_ORIENTATION=+